MNLILIFRLSLLLFLLINFTSLTQTFYRSVADVDSFAYVTINDKILILKRDQSNELQYVNSIHFVMNHNTNKFNSEVIINDYLLVSSLDTVVLFSISDRENPVELNRVSISNIFSINKFGSYCLVIQNYSSTVLGLENDSLIVKTSVSGGETSYNPYFPEWNLISFSYPYFFKANIIYKYDENDNQFNILDTINVCQNCAFNGVLANPEDTTVYVAIGCCSGSGSINWYSYEIGIDPDDPYLCIYYTGSPLLPVQGYTIKKFFGYGLLNGEGFKWFYSYDICTKFSFPWIIDPINYPIAIDSLIYRIGSQGFYYLYQRNGNNLVFHQFQLPVSVENEINSIPSQMVLEQNYPNPFNPETKINYTLPQETFVTLSVYDVLGKRVATMVNESQTANTYEVRFDGSNLPSGMYFYTLISDRNTITKKMVLVK